jgi:platelet-activating factor acetylhydrolase
MLGLRRFSRMSWPRFFIIGSGFVLFSIFLFSLTPITAPLPPYTGPHEVGVLDVETEVERRFIHDATLKETGEKAFEVRLSLTMSRFVIISLLPCQNFPHLRSACHLKHSLLTLSKA